MAPLGCFSKVEIPRPGFVSRLLSRKPKEHCFLEIQNLLASRELNQLTAADVENVLSDYEMPRPDASPRLMDFYGTALRHLSHDNELSESDRADLKHLHYLLGLTDAEATEAERRILGEVYRARLLGALADGHLSDDEKARLNRITTSFELPQSLTTSIYKEEVMKVLQRAFDAAMNDRRYTEDEEQRLSSMAKNFGITINYSAEDRQKLERFRQLARIEAGQLPVLSTVIRLQRGEVCHAEFSCRLLEKRTVTKRVNYSGPTGSIRIMKGLRYRYGSMSVQRVTSEELRQIDAGTLYITNKRLVFDGTAKNQNIPYKKLIGFTMYSDGVQVNKDTGRDPYFLGSGDLEMLGLVLDTAVSKAHESA